MFSNDLCDLCVLCGYFYGGSTVEFDRTHCERTGIEVVAMPNSPG